MTARLPRFAPPEDTPPPGAFAFLTLPRYDWPKLEEP